MILLQALTFQINGIVLLLLFLGFGGWIGWNMGVRALLTTLLCSTIALVLFVRGGPETIAIVNAFYTTLAPPIISLFTGQVTPVQPIGITLPVPTTPFLRLMGYLLLAFGVAWILDRVNLPGWYAPAPKPPYGPALGAFAGLLLVAMLLTASTGIYQIFLAEGNPPQDNIFANIISIMPDLGLGPPIIAVLFIGVILVFNLPKIWK